MTSATESPDPGSAAQAPPGSSSSGSSSSDAVGADSAARAGELLDSLERRPLGEHPDVYEQVHRHLSAALASIDDA